MDEVGCGQCVGCWVVLRCLRGGRVYGGRERKLEGEFGWPLRCPEVDGVD